MAGWTSQLGPQQISTLDATMNLANLLKQLGDRGAEKELYETMIAGMTGQLGHSPLETSRSRHRACSVDREPYTGSTTGNGADDRRGTVPPQVQTKSMTVFLQRTPPRSLTPGLSGGTY